MIDYVPDTRDLAVCPTPTPYECLLTWLMLTLISARASPPITRPERATDTRVHAVPSIHGAPLTAREIEVLHFVTLGLTNAQIADHLFLSRRTVDQHLASIYNRLGVSSRAAATRLAVLNDLCA